VWTDAVDDDVAGRPVVVVIPDDGIEDVERDEVEVGASVRDEVVVDVVV